MEPVDDRITAMTMVMPALGLPDNIIKQLPDDILYNPLPSITYEWSGDKIEGLHILLGWYSELPPDYEFSLQSSNTPVSVRSITRWLRAQIGSREYTESTRAILNELIEIRRNWIYGNSRT
jgi:hypothetical protein